MSEHSPLPSLVLMLVLAGCASQAPAPMSPQPSPAAPVSEAPAPVLDHGNLGWVPDTLQPNAASHVQNMPYVGDLEHPVVIIQDNKYQPYYIHVQLGGSVTWVNRDRTTHSVTSPIPGGSTQEGYWEGVMAPGQSFTKTFSRYTGTFTYYSTFKPDLHGNVIVVGKRR